MDNISSILRFGNDSQNNATNPIIIEFPSATTPLIDGFLSVLGCLGATLNILQMLLLRQAWIATHNTSFLYLFNLSTGDLLIASTVPVRVLDYTGQIVWKVSTCQTFIFHRYFSVYLAVNTKVLLSAERYCAVFYPIFFRKFVTMRNVLLQLSGVWILSALETWWPVEKNLTFTFWDTQGKVISICTPFGSLADVIYLTSTFLFLPIMVIAVVYGRILTRLCLTQGDGSRTGTNPNDRTLNRKMRTAKIILVIAVVYSLCWIPASLVQFYYITHVLTFFWSEWLPVFQVCGLMPFLHPVINPIIFMSTNHTLKGLVTSRTRAARAFLHSNAVVPVTRQILVHPVGVNQTTTLNTNNAFALTTTQTTNILSAPSTFDTNVLPSNTPSTNGIMIRPATRVDYSASVESASTF